MSSLSQRNIKLVIAYNGAAYHGWQRQAVGLDTVQLQIEQVAAAILRHPLHVHGAGRTDAGVHASGQVANLHTSNMTIPLDGIRRAMNSRLPGDIIVRSVTQVPLDFHASMSATGKTYRYRILVSPIRDVMTHRQVWHYWRPLDIDAMSEAGKRLIGSHDFRGFTIAAEKRENTVRTISRCDVGLVGQEIHIVVRGGGFLYNMVRIITGTLIEIGRGRWSGDQIDRILATHNRRDAGPTAPAAGLTMECVYYDEECADAD